MVESPKSGMGSARRRKELQEVDRLKQQYKLDTPQKKPYEIIDAQTQQMIDRLRQTQIRKQHLKQQQLNKKLKHKKDKQKSFVRDSKKIIMEINTNNSFMREMREDDSFMIPSPSTANATFYQGQKQAKVKVERLPKTYHDQVKASLNNSVFTTETEYARLIKIMQQERAEEKTPSHFEHIPDLQAENEQLLNASGLANGNHTIIMTDYQVPLKKVIKASYGVTYTERNNVISGDLYNKKPSKRLQFSMQQFIELSNQIEQKYLRQDVDPVSRTQSCMLQEHPFIQLNSPNASVRDQSNGVRFEKQDLRQSSDTQQYSLSQIKLFSPTAQTLLLNQEQFSDTFYPSQFTNTAKNQSSAQHHFLFPQLKTPKGEVNTNFPIDLKTSQDLMKSECQNLVRKRSRDIFTTNKKESSFRQQEKVVQYQPENQLTEITSLHDKFNYMISKNQDHNIILRQLYPNHRRSSSSNQELMHPKSTKNAAKVSQLRNNNYVRSKNLRISQDNIQ